MVCVFSQGSQPVCKVTGLLVEPYVTEVEAPVTCAGRLIAYRSRFEQVGVQAQVRQCIADGVRIKQTPSYSGALPRRAVYDVICCSQCSVAVRYAVEGDGTVVGVRLECPRLGCIGDSIMGVSVLASYDAQQ